MSCKDQQTCLAPEGQSLWTQRRSAIEVFAQTYRLTPTEMRVLEAVVEVGGIRDIAVALAVSPTTVKTHLSHIFQKTGTKGQIDLIRLVVRAASSSER